jgi:UPF0271 protein
MKLIDFNCDMGEGFGAWRMGPDEEIMPYVSSANVACGGHAGDPNVMTATVRLAGFYGVAVGAHPGYPDLQGFGRRFIRFTPDEVARFVLYQMGALWAICRAEGVELMHVKPHGALYNAASTDRELADAVVGAVRAFSAELPLYCLPGSALERAAREQGLWVVSEGFADRAYEPNGLLADRSLPGAVLTSPQQVAAQAVALASGQVAARDGTPLALQVGTICIHSDTPGAARNARAVSAALKAGGFAIAHPRAGRG